MTNPLQAQKDQILDELTKGMGQLKEAGFGEVLNITEDMRQVDVDLTAYPFIDEGAKAYTNGEQYFIVTSENVMIYLGNIDAADQDKTIEKDLTQFPRLSEVTILLGKGELEQLSAKLGDPIYLMAYCGEMVGGMMKAHENGHVDLEEAMTQALGQ